MKIKYFLIILVLVSQAEAQISFLESLVPNKATPADQVYAQIANWAKSGNHFLSLGESHGEPETVRPLNFKLAQIFRENLATKYTLCSESIADYLESIEGRDLQAKATQSLVFYGNNPSVTDFKKCKWKNNQAAITYSGFYHQYPFAKNWPADFPVSPVTSQPDNNILSQLSPKKGIYITQIETSYLAFLASYNLLKNKTIEAAEFKARVNNIAKNLEVLKTNMKLLVGDEGQVYKNKMGLFVDKKAFSIDVEHMPDEAWFLITSRGYKINQNEISLLSYLASLDDAKLNLFLNKIKKTKVFFISMRFGPDKDGLRSHTSYAGLDLDGEAELMQVEGNLLVLDYNKTELKCYGPQQANKVAPELNCDTVMF